MPLNAKHRAFVREYAIDRNATQAAIRAGYSEHTAKQQGSRLLTNADILDAVEKTQQEHAEKCGITIERVTEMLLEDRNFARQLETPAAAVSASVALAKLHGLVVDKTQHSGAVGGIGELLDAIDGRSRGLPKGG